MILIKQMLQFKKKKCLDPANVHSCRQEQRRAAHQRGVETSPQCFWGSNNNVSMATRLGHSHPDIIDHCREEVEEFFDSMDRDFDGRLSFEEFMGEESTIEKLFKNMDKNGDGLVTKQVGHILDDD